MTGFAVVFTFLFHLTFFSGCVAISGYCEQKNLHSVLCCKVQPLSKSGKYYIIILIITVKYNLSSSLLFISKFLLQVCYKISIFFIGTNNWQFIKLQVLINFNLYKLLVSFCYFYHYVNHHYFKTIRNCYVYIMY